MSKEFKWIPIDSKEKPVVGDVILLRNSKGDFGKFRYIGERHYEDCCAGITIDFSTLESLTHWSYVPEVIDYEWHHVDELKPPEFERLELYVESEKFNCFGCHKGLSNWSIDGFVPSHDRSIKITHWRRIKGPDV